MTEPTPANVHRAFGVFSSVFGYDHSEVVDLVEAIDRWVVSNRPEMTGTSNAEWKDRSFALEVGFQSCWDGNWTLSVELSISRWDDLGNDHPGVIIHPSLFHMDELDEALHAMFAMLEPIEARFGPAPGPTELDYS